MDVYGAVTLVKDNQNGLLSLDIVYYEPWQVKGDAVLLWRHYLYYNFHKAFKQLSKTFYCFESDDCVFGLNFVDPKEAESFYDAVVRKAGKECVKGKEKSGLKSLLGFGSSSGGSIGNKKKSGPKRLTIEDMSDPTEFQHLIHIGFNPVTGAFEPHNVPAEWAEFFEKAGLSKKDLEDKKTATYVAKFVQENVIDAVPSEPTAVPQPNMGHRVMPPPPPPPPANVPDEPSTLPPVPSDRANLMESIRSAGTAALKPAPKQAPSEKPAASAAAGSDIMASMLAKALAERNQKVVANGTFTIN